MLPLALYLFAQPPRALHAGELARAIDRLSVAGNVLYVAAHPDDENTRLLSWLVGAKGVRAAYLAVTRGDGGQNLIGSEQGPLLGLIRTQELLAARRIDGAEQFFTRARDFGYSKTPEETLSIWGRDEILADFVTIIRRFKPDLIITRFNPKDRDTHGHHTASAMLSEAAFAAAADPKFRPELGGAWHAKRVVWNTYSWDPKAQHPGEIKIDAGIYDPLLGESFGELAARSRSMHKSQGFGASPVRGHSNDYFKVIAGAEAKQSIFEGIDLTWARVPGAEKFAGLVKRARAEFRFDNPAASIPVLVEALDALDAMPQNPWKEHKHEELARTIAGCAGLWLEAVAADWGVVPGGKLGAKFDAINRSDAKLTLEELRLPGGEVVKVGKPLVRDESDVIDHAVTATGPLSNPYWLAEKPEPGLYTVKDPAMVGLPENPPALPVEFVVSINGHRLAIERPLLYKWTDPVAGERYRPVAIVPAVTVTPARGLLVFADGKAKPLHVTVKAGAANTSGTLKPELPAGWRIEPATQNYQLAARGDEAELQFTVHPPEKASSGALHFGAHALTTIEHSHIPIQTLFPDGEVKLVRFDLKKTHTRVGYVAGAGDEVADALRQVGYDVTALSEETLASEPLGRFDAIVTGVRAWNVDKRLPYLHARLMEYVKGGGTLVVQYNTSNRFGQVTTNIGPHPFEISQERVTEEHAAVTMAEHPILKFPNRIAAGDFDGWIQERGLYFAGKWDAKYDAPLAMNDAGEPARKGGLLVTKYGKGAFIYTGLAFFRQLPAGVPGAYRLFANLISYGR